MVWASWLVNSIFLVLFLQYGFARSDHLLLYSNKNSSATTTINTTQGAAALRSTIFHPYESEPPDYQSYLSVPLISVNFVHHVYTYIGSPPQRRLLIVDTGSRLTALPCEPCDHCGRHSSTSYFDPSLSLTGKIRDCTSCQFHTSKCITNQCMFAESFVEGSKLSGYEVEDIVWLGSHDTHRSMEHYAHFSVPFTFGCETYESGLFKVQYADGIMGLSRHQKTIIDTMFDMGSVRTNSFSLCLTKNSGYLSIAGTKYRFPDLGHLEPMVFVPTSSNQGWYSVQVLSVSLNDILLTQDKDCLDQFNIDKGTVIDNGTTDTYLPRCVAHVLQSAWHILTGKEYNNQQSWLSFDQFWNLPKVHIRLKGHYVWTLTPESYMEHFTDNLNFDPMVRWTGLHQFTNRLYADETKGCILGSTAMYNHDILFDKHNKMIGIAKSACLV